MGSWGYVVQYHQILLVQTWFFNAKLGFAGLVLRTESDSVFIAEQQYIVGVFVRSSVKRAY